MQADGFVNLLVELPSPLMSCGANQLRKPLACRSAYSQSANSWSLVGVDGPRFSTLRTTIRLREVPEGFNGGRRRRASNHFRTILAAFRRTERLRRRSNNAGKLFLKFQRWKGTTWHVANSARNAASGPISDNSEAAPFEVPEGFNGGVDEIARA